MPSSYKSLKLGVGRFLAEFWYVGQPDWKQTIRDNGEFLRDRIMEAETLAGGLDRQI